MTSLTPRFLAETAGFEMTILFDQGPRRHLRFKNPRSDGYWFDVITTPKALTFRGDGETYCFSLGDEPDMLRLFRAGVHRDGSLHINPGYWVTKLTTDRAAATCYSHDAFTAYAAEALAEAEREFPGVSEAWHEYAEGRDSFYNTDYQSDAVEALNSFEFGAGQVTRCITCSESIEQPAQPVDAVKKWIGKHLSVGHKLREEKLAGFEFPDASDIDLDDLDWWFLFACSGIVWGIAQYDAYKRVHRGGRARHKVTFSGAHREIEHPQECDWLPYGSRCDFDKASGLHEGEQPPVVTGTMWARPVGVHDHLVSEPCDPGCTLLVQYEEFTEPGSDVASGFWPAALAGAREEFAAWTSPPAAPFTVAGTTPAATVSGAEPKAVA